MRKIFTLFFCAASLATGLAQQESYFTNPVIHGDVADPSIIRIDQTYYITGTSSEWAPLLSGFHLYRFGELAANRTCIRREAGMD